MLNEPVVRTPTWYEQLVIRLLVTIGILSIINFCYHFFRPEFIGHPLLYGLLCAVMVYGLLRDLSLWYYYLHIKVPRTPIATRRFTVDVLTTYYPGEPYDMIVNTLEAIQQIRYPHTTYLCDEADDPYLKEVCAKLGVIHVTRQVRVNAKAGNINNALQQATGEICLILDPDHIPQPDFLDYIVPHFQDPEIGFVQTVQAYYNKFDSIVAKGSAQQTFHFYGPMMMCMNTYGTVNAIGANCTFRRAALDSIGGHAPGLAEDMHTAMLLYREGWKAVYVPRILAKGLVPATLTAYFKQQIKWSRGTFDLLFKVYPRIFSRLTWRQRLHYFLIPVHYLAGVAYLIGFLIPILSLFLSDVPWTGHFGYFVLIVLPVIFSSFVLRFYIQKWLVSDDERGFHIVGGVLEIIGWWVFTLGFVYTLFDKKVPYLPTPKNDEDRTHPSLLVPNLVVAMLSLIAIAYGLNRDLTPFSIIMAAFAFLNAGFMFFSVYLAFGVTNRLRTFRRRLPRLLRTFGRHGKRQLLLGLDAMTVTVRSLAPLLLILVTLAAFHYTDAYEQQPLAAADPNASETMAPGIKLGVFAPSAAGGLTDTDELNRTEATLGYRPEIISSYVAWSGQLDLAEVDHHLRTIDSLGADPMITWEPWVSHFSASDTLPEASEERRALHHIAAGTYDAYILRFARQVRDLNRRVYVRFAHEFDNPAYPWSPAGGNTPDDFRRAWRHVHDLFREEGALNAVWVWNPWRSTDIAPYYPGDEYVDLIGLTALNYGPGYTNLDDYPFSESYPHFRRTLRSITDKPVLLAEFGSLGDLETKAAWVTQATNYIAESCPEIVGIVAFESQFDDNVLLEDSSAQQMLDWTGSAAFLFRPDLPVAPGPVTLYASFPQREVPSGIVGVGYKKSGGWMNSEYIPARKNIVEDYERMHRAGINTVRVTDPGIYSHNLLGLAEEFDLRVIYGFWVDDGIDFLNDTDRLRDLENEILDKVESHLDRPALLHWNFGNDVLTALARRYAHPELHAQRTAYVEWVNRVIGRIKAYDPQRPIFHVLSGRPGADLLLKTYPLLSGNTDAIGLRTNWNNHPETVHKLRETYGDRIVLADMKPTADEQSLLSPWPEYVVLSNWQNEWRTNAVSFDGLLDFHGRRTPAFTDWLNSRGDTTSHPPELPRLEILPPARIPYPREEVTYRALQWRGGTWSELDSVPPGLSLEWSLVYRNAFGHATGLKDLGDGTEQQLPFPENHLRYELRLTVTDGEFSRSVHTPLLPK